MEMSINFKKLFNFDDSGSHTPSTSSLENSYQFQQQPSMISSQSNHVSIHYKFNEALFFDSSHQNDNEINILQDLSSIGRSNDESFQKQRRVKGSSFQQYSKPSNVTNERKQAVKEQKTFVVSEKDAKAPGERLYYESKVQNERRLRELERIKHEMQQQEKREVTFKPAINQKSKKILELVESPLRKLREMEKGNKLKKSEKQVKSYAERKEEEELRNCTFKPAILKTPKALHSSYNNRSSSDIGTVFDSLYKEHRAKQERQQRMIQESEKKTKTMTKEQLEEFFNRNEEYIQERRHREEILRAVSSQYDLTSGRKLFEPKTNVGSLNTSVSMARFNNEQELRKSCQKVKSPRELLSPKNGQREMNGFGSNPKSGLKQKSRSNASLKNNKNITNDGMNKKPNQSSGQVKRNNTTNVNKKGKPLPYQLTRFVQEEPQEFENNQTSQLSGDNDYCQNGVSAFSYPKSSIFSKIVVKEDGDERVVIEEEQVQGEDQCQGGVMKMQDVRGGASFRRQQQHDGWGQNSYNVSGFSQTQRIELHKDPSNINIKHEDEHQQNIEQVHQEEHFHQHDEQLYDTLFTQQQQDNEQDEGAVESGDGLEQDGENGQYDGHQMCKTDQQQNHQGNFLQSIIKNPLYAHKYNDLLALDDVQNIQQVNCDAELIESHVIQAGEEQPTGYRDLQLQKEKNDGEKVQGQEILLKSSTVFSRPIFLGKDSSEEENDQKPPAKSWQEIFHASSKFQHSPDDAPSQSEFSERSRVSEMKVYSSLSPVQSPKKKSINIASLLKAKKKQIQKSQQS